MQLPKEWGLSDAGPVISPDGNTVAFVRSQLSGAADLYTVPLAGGEPTALTTDGKTTDEIFTPMWTADGKFICFNSTRSGPERTWRIRSHGGPIEPETVYPGTGAPSPDGSRLVYQGPSAFSGSSVWRASLSSEGGSVVEKQQLLNDSAYDYAPRLSPDGSEMVFESMRSGSDQIWKSNSDGSNARRLTSFTGIAGSPRWSANGKAIAFDYLPEGQIFRQVYTMDAEGRNQQLLISGSYNNSIPSWSRDGKTIYFCSDRSGSFQIWRHDMASGRETQLTRDGGLASMESLDGRTLYFSKLSGGGIWSIPVFGGETQHITSALHFGYWGEFAVTENGLYLIDSDTDPGPSLMYFSFRTRQLKPVFNLNEAPRKAVPWSANLGASRDGRTVLFVLGTFRSSLVMAENLQ
ncbi:DPP IV N-terminal domain-containing protein [Occallatibacter savannae]|uniref:DPP IV N-terminal domain-containing protein n=1 Tax=Occallatibacter savannae TaxID=1002691 RepID=UPI001EF5F49A|nr:DPP IV N-terminal domain-containing protein [Occallatibacter savannae]